MSNLLAKKMNASELKVLYVPNNEEGRKFIGVLDELDVDPEFSNYEYDIYSTEVILEELEDYIPDNGEEDTVDLYIRELGYYTLVMLDK